MKKVSLAMIFGITLLSLGIVLLSLNYYLDKLDQEIFKVWRLTHRCHTVLGCPYPPVHYWEYSQPFWYIGIAICDAGAVILSVKILRNRMNLKRGSVNSSVM